MLSYNRPIAVFAPAARSIAIAALMGATMLAMPLAPARAQGAMAAPPAPAAAAPATTDKAAAETKAESLEDRITHLHTSLKITAPEEADWNNVAQAMRDNAANMQKLMADKAAKAPDTMTAVADLENYETFAKAHVAGLKNLISSFKKLYNAMPDPQKKIADQVFQTAHQEGGPSHG